MDSSQGNFNLEILDIGVNGESFSFTSNHLLALVYTEDIKTNTIHVEITITDSETAAISNMQGMEPVVLSYTDNEENTHSCSLVVYDIQDRSSFEGKAKATLMCCSPEFISNAAIKVSRRFGAGEGKLISEIVEQDVMRSLLKTNKPVVVEETKNKFSFISAYWCPFTIIKWLAAKGIGKTGSGPNATAGYCFYENIRGYYFESFDSFSKKPVTRVFVVGYDPEIGEDRGNKIPVDKMTVVSTSDVLKGLNLGSYCSNVMTLDLKDMKYSEFPFNINEYYKTVPKLNENTNLPLYYAAFEKDTAATRIMSKLIDTALFTEGTHTQDFTKHISQSSLREKLFYNKEVELEYVGDLSLYVGDVVELVSYKGKTKEKDTKNSGKYVVGKIIREFRSATDNMTTKVTLYTDSPGVE
jgi:hypothetical protein